MPAGHIADIHQADAALPPVLCLARNTCRITLPVGVGPGRQARTGRPGNTMVAGKPLTHQALDHLVGNILDMMYSLAQGQELNRVSSLDISPGLMPMAAMELV